MDVRLTDLPWLVLPPEDLRTQIRGISAFDPDAPAIAQSLAGYRLNPNQLYLLGNVVAALTVERHDAIRLGVLSNGTNDLLLHALCKHQKNTVIPGPI